MENKNTLWEYTKCKIRTETITFSSKKAKERNEKQKALESKLKILEEQLHFNNKIITEYNNCKSEWEEILRFKAEGIKLRSKAKWTEDGEKNTQYFLNLEKQTSDSNHIKKLIDNDGNEITQRYNNGTTTFL